MTNFESIKGMDIEEMAKFNINWIDDGWQQIAFQTSDGQLFYKEEDAIIHEISWLKSEVIK